MSLLSQEARSSLTGVGFVQQTVRHLRVSCGGVTTEASARIGFVRAGCPTSALNPPHLRNAQGVEIFHCSQALRWEYSLQICTRWG
jgi:hypothetical protein